MSKLQALSRWERENVSGLPGGWWTADFDPAFE